MNEHTSVKDQAEDHRNRIQPASIELQAAQALLKRHRAQGLMALNELFRSGTAPDPSPNGRYAGNFIFIDIAPGLTQLAQGLAGAWMPWLGKTFNTAQQAGDNIFAKDSYPLARFFNPFYQGFVADGPDSYRAFGFRTYSAPGLFDSDRRVLKIDYKLKENPAPTVRRVLDEVVQLPENLYLGKAHLHWWWERWQTVAYFTLTK